VAIAESRLALAGIAIWRRAIQLRGAKAGKRSGGGSLSSQLFRSIRSNRLFLLLNALEHNMNKDIDPTLHHS
jgi:hypothetical protein